MRLALGLSVGLNLLLAMLVAALASADAERRSLVSVDSSDASSAAARGAILEGEIQQFDAGALDAPSYYAALRARGVTHEETKPILRAHLLRVHAPESAPVSYWADSERAALARRLERLDAEAPVRAALRALFGATAATDEAFVDLFQPLRDRLPFLASEAQLLVLRHELEQRLELTRAREGCPSPRVCSTAARPVQDEIEWLTERFDAATAFEIAVRSSARAADLRRIGLDIDETQFREAFAVLAALDAEPSAPAIRAARHDLRGLLGDAAFDRLWAARDPAFEVVERVLARQGLDAGRRMAAYGVINRAQDDLFAAAETAAVDPERASRLAREAADAERRRLGELVGERAAAELLSERASALTARMEETRPPAPSNRSSSVDRSSQGGETL